MLYNVIANNINVAKLYIDDVILSAGDQTADFLLCIDALLRWFTAIERLLLLLSSSSAVIYLKRSLCGDRILADDAIASDFVVVNDEVVFVHRRTLFFATLFFVILNFVVCESVRWLPTNILGCSIIVLIFRPYRCTFETHFFTLQSVCRLFASDQMKRNDVGVVFNSVSVWVLMCLCALLFRFTSVYDSGFLLFFSTENPNTNQWWRAVKENALNWYLFVCLFCFILLIRIDAKWLKINRIFYRRENKFKTINEKCGVLRFSHTHK